MRNGPNVPILLALVVGLAGCAQEADREPTMDQEAAAGAEMETTSSVRQMYPNLSAEVVFENERVVAQHIVGEPGQWAGEHSHVGGQLAVALKGGIQTYREGGEETDVTYEDGDVFWVEPTEAHDHAVKGDSPIEAILISMAPMEGMGGGMQEYPNITTDVVFENERVVAQRLVTEPGQWAGEHSHVAPQMVVVLKGGTMTYREGGEETQVTYEDGDVFWIEPTEAHDHAAMGEVPGDAILITFK